MGKVTVDLDKPVKRISTGILGLDEMLYGGLPEGSQNIIIGDAGSCKTLLAFNIAYYCAKNGIPSTVLTIDQTSNDMLRNAVSAFVHFADVKELVDKGTFNTVEIEIDEELSSRESITYFISEIVKGVRMNDSKLLVFDSLSVLRALSADDRSFTRMVNYMVESFRNVGITSIITMEIQNGQGDRHKVPGLYEDSMFDGIIKLSNITKAGVTTHSASVVKMRFSKYKTASAQLSVTPDGIVIKSATKLAGDEMQ